MSMKLDYSQAESIKIDLVDYMKTMVESLSSKYLGGEKVSTPFNEKLFTVNVRSSKLSKENKKKMFHTVTA